MRAISQILILSVSPKGFFPGIFTPGGKVQLLMRQLLSLSFMNCGKYECLAWTRSHYSNQQSGWVEMGTNSNTTGLDDWTHFGYQINYLHLWKFSSTITANLLPLIMFLRRQKLSNTQVIHHMKWLIQIVLLHKPYIINSDRNSNIIFLLDS